MYYHFVRVKGVHCLYILTCFGDFFYHFKFHEFSSLKS